MSHELPSFRHSPVGGLPLDTVNARSVAADTSFDDSKLNFFKAPPLQLFDDVFVLRHKSIIVDSNFRPIKTASNEHVYWHPTPMPTSLNEDALGKEALSRLNQLASASRQLKHYNNCLDLRNLTYNSVFLMHPFEWYPYGHFFDTIQRLFYIDDSVKQIKTLLVSDFRRVSSFATHLEILGYLGSQIISMPPHATSFRVSKLEVSSSPAPYSAFTSRSIKWLRKKYLSSSMFRCFCEYHGRFIDQSKPFALFLDRSTAGSRFITNSDRLITLVESLGFYVVRFTGHEDILTTLHLFANAKFIFGAHGAMFVNTIFCREDAVVLEACPSNRINQCMVRMPKPCLNHDLVVFQGDVSYNITINCEWFGDYVASKLSSQ